MNALKNRLQSHSSIAFKKYIAAIAVVVVIRGVQVND